MALSDRKIPIITGINDVPSTTGGANHPNASLLCSKYNALIDDLTAITPATIPTTLPTSSIYVNSATGNDANTGLTTGQSVQTIERGLEIAAGFFAGWLPAADLTLSNFQYPLLEIRLTGTFTNPNFDCSQIFGDNIDDAFYPQLRIIGDATTHPILIFNPDSNHTFFRDNPNSKAQLYFQYITIKVGYDLTISNLHNSIWFEDCAFEIANLPNRVGANIILSIFNSLAVFLRCDFSLGNANQNEFYHFIWVTAGSKVMLTRCTFESIPALWTEANSIVITDNAQVSNYWAGPNAFGTTAVPIYIDCGSYIDPNIIARDKIEIIAGFAVVANQLYLPNDIIYNGGQSAITNAIAGTEIATINSILAALRTAGIIVK